jgi:UDP-N-acetylglucosamine acyltransferase
MRIRARGVLIMKGARLEGHVTVDAGGEERTMIGPFSRMLKHSHAGHDSIIGADAVISCGAKIGGHTIIGNDCNIGLNSVIHQRQNIATGAMIGMGSVVTKSLKTQPYRTYAGNPAKELGMNDKHPKYPEYTANMKEWL